MKIAGAAPARTGSRSEGVTILVAQARAACGAVPRGMLRALPGGAGSGTAAQSRATGGACAAGAGRGPARDPADYRSPSTSQHAASAARRRRLG